MFGHLWDKFGAILQLDSILFPIYLWELQGHACMQILTAVGPRWPDFHF